MSDAANLSQNRAAELARQLIAQKPVYIDTETTGLDKDAEVIEISIVDWDGSVLFTSLVKPPRAIPLDAQRVHHIKDADFASAPAWPILGHEFVPFCTAGR